jgi:hypothetical protein
MNRVMNPGCFARIPDTTTKKRSGKKGKRKCKASQKAHPVRNKSWIIHLHFIHSFIHSFIQLAILNRSRTNFIIVYRCWKLEHRWLIIVFLSAGFQLLNSCSSAVPFLYTSLCFDQKRKDPQRWQQWCGSRSVCFGCPGSVSTRYGSGSFYHRPKIVRKPWFLLFCDFFMTFYLWKIMYLWLQKLISLNWRKKILFVAVLKVTDANSRIIQNPLL